VPSGGITLPPYYRPTPNLASANVYYSGQEELGPDEMRVSFIRSTPIPVTRSQLAHALWLSSAMASASSLPVVNDIFFTHLHVDHYADLPYLYAFAPWMGRWKPLRVHGPSGRTPKDGIKTMIDGMKFNVLKFSRITKLRFCGAHEP
jgi:ribonuclease Z